MLEEGSYGRVTKRICFANPGDQQDLKITFASTDIRCVGDPGLPAQANCDGGAGLAGAGSLYSGKVLATSTIRITDHYGSLPPNPPRPDCSDTLTCTATVVDLPMDIGTQCTNLVAAPPFAP